MKDGNENNVVTFDKTRKRKPQQPKRPLTLKEALMGSLQQDTTDQARDYDECYARLLRIKARLARNNLECDDEKREALTDKLQDIEDEAHWDIIHARAVHRWQIAHKLELLEELMHIGTWGDRREYFLLNSVRLDLEHADWRTKAANEPDLPEKEGA